MEALSVLWNSGVMQPLINVLALMYSVLFHNFGLSIILLTVVLRVALIPLTVRQTRQMRSMSALQPKMKALQEKYGKGGDARARQQEMAQLWREAGVSPIGCLGPMVVQIPIWIGLDRAIFRVVPSTPDGMANLSNILYSWNPAKAQVPMHSGFLGMDLVGLVSAQPAVWSILLPVLVGATMWLTQKMTTAPSADPKQRQTNQMMLWLLPIMFGFFTFQFPSGLAIFILFSNVIGIVIQYFVNGKQNPFSTPVPVPDTMAAMVSGPCTAAFSGWISWAWSPRSRQFGASSCPCSLAPRCG